MNYVDWEYIGTRGCSFQPPALRTVIKQFREVGTVLLSYKTPFNIGAGDPQALVPDLLRKESRDNPDESPRQRSGTAETKKPNGL